MDDSSGLSNLGRPLDTEYLSNLLVILISVGAFFGFGASAFLSGGGIVGSLRVAAGSLLSTFLAWALAREVDPDYHLTAVLAASGAVAAVAVNGVPSLLLAFWALFTFRVLNRSTGLEAGPLDTLLSAGLALWLGYSLSWVIPGASAAIFAADGLARNPKRAQFVPGAITGAAAGYFLYGDPGVWGGFSGFPVKLGLVLALSTLFLLVIYDSREVEASGDRTGRRLSARRVQLTQVIALTVALLLPLWEGVAGFHASVTLWAVIGGSFLVHLAAAMGIGLDYLEGKLT